MVDYRDFSEEEEKIYDREIGKLKQRLQNGASLDDACETIDVEHEELRQVIADDILKIMIAELHYNKGKNLDQIASTLKTTIEKVKDAHRIMIEDVMYTVNKGQQPSV